MLTVLAVYLNRIYIQWAALKAMHERGTTSFSCGPPEPSLLDEISHMLHVAH